MNSSFPNRWSFSFLNLTFSRWRSPETPLREVDKSKQKNNDQEPIQSSSTSCPKHQTGEGQAQPTRHLKLEQWKVDRTIFPNRWPQDYPKIELTISQRQTQSGRTLKIRIKHNRSTPAYVILYAFHNILSTVKYCNIHRKKNSNSTA